MSRRQGTSTLSPLIWLAVVILILYFARAVLIPLALALTLNFLLTPLVMWFQKLPMGRVPAVVLALLISVVAIGGLGWVVPPVRLCSFSFWSAVKAIRIPSGDQEG